MEESNEGIDVDDWMDWGNVVLMPSIWGHKMETKKFTFSSWEIGFWWMTNNFCHIKMAQWPSQFDHFFQLNTFNQCSTQFLSFFVFFIVPFFPFHRFFQQHPNQLHLNPPRKAVSFFFKLFFFSAKNLVIEKLIFSSPEEDLSSVFPATTKPNTFESMEKSSKPFVNFLNLVTKQLIVSWPEENLWPREIPKQKWTKFFEKESKGGGRHWYTCYPH